MSDDDKELTFADKVNAVVGKMVEANGVWQIPEEVAKDLPEEIIFAATQEKRLRDTQNSFHRVNKKAKELETINSKLTSHLVDNATLHLSNEQKEELEGLKIQDPDKWREKLNEYETEARKILTQKVSEFTTEGQVVSELEERKIKLAAFTESTKIELTDDIIQNELPAAYSRQLEKGEITFDEFLTKAQKFLTKGKVIQGSTEDPDKTTNLGKLAGGPEPDKEAQEGDLEQQYRKNTIF